MNSRYSLFRASWALHITNGVLALFVVFELLFFREIASASAFLIATLLLSILLIVPRLRSLQSLKRYDSLLLYTAKQSKWLGLWMAIWFLTYTCVLLLVDRQPLIPPQIFLGGTTLTILLILVLLSNSWSYQHAHWWKHINMFVWAVPGLLLSYALISPGLMRNSGFFIIIVALLLIESFGLTGVFVNQPDYFARMRLCLIGASIFIGATGVLLAVR